MIKSVPEKLIYCISSNKVDFCFLGLCYIRYLRIYVHRLFSIMGILSKKTLLLVYASATDHET